MTDLLVVDGREIPVRVRHHPTARRLILRLDPKGNGVVVTLPKGVPEREALKLAQRNEVWIANQLLKVDPVEPLADGSLFPLRGEDHVLHHVQKTRGTVRQEGNALYIPCEPEFLTRRLCDWLKKQARSDIAPLVAELAGQLGKRYGRISVRDTVSRWGSCSSDGNLSFNWRLILAPPEVLRYVVAHEVSHLRYMDHSPAFWETVESLHEGHQQQRRWLKKNGARLQGFAQGG